MLKAPFKIFIAGALATVAMGGAANATGITSYNATLASPGFYAGTGNPSTGFTVYTDNNVELGLAVQYRYVGGVPPSPTTGNVYIVQDGGQPCYTTTCALWNFDFSVNLNMNNATTGYPTLSQITSLMTITNKGTGNSVQFNPLSAYSDSYGWNGGPADNVAIKYELTDWGFQNSENLGWSLPGFNPYIPGTYQITLSVLQGTSSLGSVSETIDAVPSPGTLSLFAAGLCALGLIVWRRKKARTAA